MVNFFIGLKLLFVTFVASFLHHEGHEVHEDFKSLCLNVILGALRDLRGFNQSGSNSS